MDADRKDRTLNFSASWVPGRRMRNHSSPRGGGWALSWGHPSVGGGVEACRLECAWAKCALSGASFASLSPIAATRVTRLRRIVYPEFPDNDGIPVSYDGNDCASVRCTIQPSATPIATVSHRRSQAVAGGS